MDTSLNLLYKGKTVDNITSAKITVDTIHAENAVTLSSPAFVVNNQSQVYGNWLFISSGIMAKNEDKKTRKRASVIDVYDLRQGEYKFSFYVRQQKNMKLNSFCVSGNTFIALHGNYVSFSKLNPHYFNQL
jgi:hypothetical protein